MNSSRVLPTLLLVWSLRADTPPAAAATAPATAPAAAPVTASAPAAPTPSPTATPTGTGTPTATATNAVPVEFGLDPRLGALPTENLRFKPRTEYIEKQNKRASTRLQGLKALRGTTNYLEEFSQSVESILTSDASETLKEQTRKLTLLELAHLREEAAVKDRDGGHLERALQLLAEFVERYPRDPAVPEVLLRQGHLLRQLGLRDEAIEKFYLVLRSVPRLEGANLAYSRRLVLMAQSAIADTMAEVGRHPEAVDLYARILQSKSEELEVEVVRVKQLRSVQESSKPLVTEGFARRFLEDFPESEFIPEVRHILGNAYRQQGDRTAAMEQYQLLLEAIELAPENRRPHWHRWKLKVGNDLANHFFLEGDTPAALALYRALATTHEDPKNRQAFLYQVGLCEERLGHADAALKTYSDILTLKDQPGLPTNSPSLQLLQNMASLRISVLKSEAEARKAKGSGTSAP